MASRPSVPSYNAGFYSPRRGGNPRYPSLWRGCVGAWCPSLGPTGSRLFDWSLYGNHGTLTNMDAATDWIVSGGQYCLDFDGSNDYVATGHGGVLYEQGGGYDKAYSVSIWVKANTNAVRHTILSDFASDLSTVTCLIEFGGYLRPSTEINCQVGGGQNYLTMVSGFVTGQWYHLVLTYDGKQDSNSVRGYVNGIFIGSRSTGSTGATKSTQALSIGRWGAYGGSYLNGQVDDVRLYYGRILYESEIRTLATRRGIAYELDYGFDAFGSAAAPPAQASTSNLLLMGVG